MSPSRSFDASIPLLTEVLPEPDNATLDVPPLTFSTAASARRAAAPSPAPVVAPPAPRPAVAPSSYAPTHHPGTVPPVTPVSSVTFAGGAAPAPRTAPAAVEVVAPSAAAPVAAAPGPAGPAPARTAALSEQQWETLERRVSERVLLQLQDRVDFILEQRLRDNMADVLHRALNDLTEEIRKGLQQTLEAVVTRAVAQEVAHLQSLQQ
jgi:hypothetical protein